MKGDEGMDLRNERRREEVIQQNRLAAQAQPFLDDPEGMVMLESAIGASEHRLYELSLGRVIARLAEELSAMEAQLEAMRSGMPKAIDDRMAEPVGAGHAGGERC